MTYEMSTKEVRLLQKHALYVLKVYDAFCAKHNLPYTLGFGTLLGAVRNQGMIPWDDDIDVVMKRPDYERFVALAKSELNSEVFVQNHHTDPHYIHAFTRLNLRDTLAIQEDWAELDFSKGIFIDVFPLDRIAPSLRQDQHARRINFYRRCKLSKLKKHYETDTGPIRNALKKILLKPFSYRYLNEQLNKEAQRYNDQTDLPKIASLCEGVISYYYQSPFEKTYLDEIVLIPFEDGLYPAPKEHHLLLAQLYPNYMLFPPLELQKPHHGFVQLKFRDDIDALLESI